MTVSTGGMPRPWPRGYDEQLVKALDFELVELAIRYDRTLLETRMRREHLLLNNNTSRPHKKYGRVTTTKIKRMKAMHAAGEKMDYIAHVCGVVRQTVTKYVGTQGVGVGRGRMRETA